LNLNQKPLSVCLSLLFLAALLWLVPLGRTQSQKHLAVYAPATLYSVPITPMDGHDYVGLADALEPLGTVEAREDGKKWKLRFTPSGGREVDAEFQDRKNKGKVRGQDFELSGNFHMENGRGYVPLHNLGSMLPMFVGLSSEFRESALRLLLGNVTIHFNQEVQKGTPSKLVLTFSSPVNPMVATEPGRLRLVFRREPLVNSGPDNVQTGDTTIASTNYSENAGIPQFTVNSSVPLTAVFTDSNKTITITPAAPVTTATTEPATPPPPPPATTTTTTTTPTTPPAPPAPVSPRFLVVIDPAHGGDERGAAITDAIKEKDVNLAFARRLQHELQNKGMNAILLRSGDNTVGLDDRAIATNSAHPSLYLCVHAANLGTGMRIFTALMPPVGVNSRKFLPWQQAQSPFLDLSSQVAGSISAELSNRQIAVTALPAPLRPLRNVAAPAIALEMAPPEDEAEGISGTEYQQNIAAAVANGIAAMKTKLQGAR
jgi:N-acetylmuramoyl-L-alanine amidase